ncbi:MAG TPA: 1-acyl-sn-glycerol-3-phosphate acyltransferase [Spirochaetota bacterium]|nr:1-acyl-sn-glycerol-3-phosphate acyltransferase [Spirochaetota bacterium]HOM38126.1 1-acyl-sn-glycerol-3-phosphate acyltransferase [Spirochaetota bacterium]HPQ48928.1 1-acyl-sn-glycerol-3-phosphate acyltransferase [Spirochaetota bacterium]
MDKELEKKLLKEFHSTVEEMKKNSDPNLNSVITPKKVFQPAFLANREIFKKFLDKLILEGSGIIGENNLLEFYQYFKNGESCLILSEHKSNFDVPVFFAVMYNQKKQIFREIFEKIVFVAGRKLNEEEFFIKTMAEQFHRVIVVPKSDSDDPTALKINLATQKFIKENKKNYIFLVFPTGTRSKPWEPETYKPLREVFNYIKSFNKIIFMSIDGNCLPPMPTKMSGEIPKQDVIKLIFSKVYDTLEIINQKKEEWEKTEKDIDFKQFFMNFVIKSIYSQKERRDECPII